MNLGPFKGQKGALHSSATLEAGPGLRYFLISAEVPVMIASSWKALAQARLDISLGVHAPHRDLVKASRLYSRESNESGPKENLFFKFVNVLIFTKRDQS